IGQETESGLFRGAAIGAISGAVFSIDVFESSLVIWHSDETGVGCVLYLVDVIGSLLSGKLVREKMGPEMLSAVTSQMSSTETTFEEVEFGFEAGVYEATELTDLIRFENKREIKIALWRAHDEEMRELYEYQAAGVEIGAAASNAEVRTRITAVSSHCTFRDT
ncbi:NEP1-interacting protein-like 1, partial [Papaver somniferum]|uniref:NEP1-interacting protein-like 1 n=1 Tax=Papaver somniferum TaxID=3469 RepID=UPI000E7056C6